MINWQLDLVLFNSVCNHARDWQIRRLLRSHTILLITHTIPDQIGLHYLPLPLLIFLTKKWP